jgi:hypothetical protein
LLSGYDEFSCNEWNDVHLPPNDDFVGTDDTFYNDVEEGCDSTVRMRREAIEGDEEYEYLFAAKEGSTLDKDGGFICLSGTDVNGVKFSNLIKFGSTLGTPPDWFDCKSQGNRLDETIPPGITAEDGQSFQRKGKGNLPGDFVWEVNETSVGRKNAGQNLMLHDAVE